MKRKMFSFVYWSNISPGGDASREELHRIFWSSIVNMCTWSIGHVCKEMVYWPCVQKKWPCVQKICQLAMCAKKVTLSCVQRNYCQSVEWSIGHLSHCHMTCFVFCQLVIVSRGQSLMPLIFCTNIVTLVENLILG